MARPAGWDAKTYQNFKRANPNLEPNSEDTAHMLAAGPKMNWRSSADGMMKWKGGMETKMQNMGARMRKNASMMFNDIKKKGVHIADDKAILGKK